MFRPLSKYPLTFFAVVVMAASFAVFMLGLAGELPTVGFWRGLVIPAYLTMLFSAVIRTALPVAQNIPYVVFMLIGVALWLMPFVAADRIIRRHRQRRVAAV